MNRPSLYIVLLSCIILMFIFPASAATILVAENGGDYTDIQDAVDNAEAGDTITIMPGEYTGLITINKPLELEGSGPDTIITAEGDSKVLLISADNVMISKLALHGGTSGIYIDDSDGTLIKECIFTGSETSVSVYESSGCSIESCDIEGNLIGIELHNSNSTVLSDNSITAVARGISLRSSENINVKENNLYECEVGISAEKVSESTIEGNDLSDMVGGVVLIASERCHISENNVADVFQYTQFFTSQDCIVDANGLEDAEYFTADIFSDTYYIFENYSVTGHDYALSYHMYTPSDTSGYRLMEKPINLTFIKVSETSSGYVILEAETNLSEIEGYDPETYGFYNIDSSEKIVSELTIENDTLRTQAVVEGPDTGHYALLVRKERGWIRALAFMVVIIVIGSVILIYRRKGK